VPPTAVTLGSLAGAAGWLGPEVSPKPPIPGLEPPSPDETKNGHTRTGQVGEILGIGLQLAAADEGLPRSVTEGKFAAVPAAGQNRR